MSSRNEQDDKKKRNAKIEQEVLASRGYSLADAIGRMGGENLLKGTSPISRKQQAEIEVERYLEKNLIDGEGALEVVLQRRYKTSETVFDFGYDRPLDGLAALIEHLLSCEQRLQEFVTEIDSEWGRMYREKPHFETGKGEPDSDDPYTFASVRAKLQKLAERIKQSLAE
ncbi:hypothetical protein Q31b_29900 [Novipirellula aureliae]|uniref:Uncharacterized protein n=1 Tax=Novipirellula aureliae TaxID=2527966 RepID=A0A5C6E1J9_9BACT|nr:hypothetical protein [Novipirellula aureliae]TWU41541.1 hypothetical protein Q31b_29900 [Novipirellula aureliae]